MSIEKIECLEQLVTLTLQALNDLHVEKTSLEERIRRLEKEKKVALKENEAARGSLHKLKQLEISHRKLEKDRSVVRLKVKNALHKIEQMDFL